MSKYNSISIFVPAYNEAGNLEGAVRDIVSAAEEVFEDYEVLIVNDGSTDGTGEKAERLARENSRIQVIHNPGNLGFARCYQIALARAEKDHFIFLPGDHEIAAQSVREIFASVGRADVVVPYIQNHQARAWHRRVMSRVCVFLSNRVSGFKLKYYQGPAVYPTALARRLPTSTSGLFMLTEMLVHALKEGYSYIEVGLVHQQREYGRSKAVSLGSILMAANTIALLWLNVRLTAVRPVDLTAFTVKVRDNPDSVA